MDTITIRGGTDALESGVPHSIAVLAIIICKIVVYASIDGRCGSAYLLEGTGSSVSGSALWKLL
jgi:hypothetical protein